MRKQSAVDRGRNKPRSVSVSASWRSVATLFSRPTKPLRFTPLASNHRSTDTGSVGPASIAYTIASTTDSRGTPCSALRLDSPFFSNMWVNLSAGPLTLHVDKQHPQFVQHVGHHRCLVRSQITLCFFFQDTERIDMVSRHI